MDEGVLRQQEKRAKERLERDYLQFDQQLGKLEARLSLPPYAQPSEVIAWASVLKQTVGKIEQIVAQSKENVRVDWAVFEQAWWVGVQADSESRFLFSDYLLFLDQIERRYAARLLDFTR